MKRFVPGWRAAGYTALLLGATVLAVALGWYALGTQLNHFSEDQLARLQAGSDPTPQCAILAIDEQTLREMGGMPKLRHILAEGLRLIAPVRPPVVALDFILPDQEDAKDDAALASAMHQLPRVVLGSNMLPGGGGWEDPYAPFREAASAVSHVHAAQDADGVTRSYPLEKIAGHDRRWGLALETYRWLEPNRAILETPESVSIGSAVEIPAPWSQNRLMRVEFLADPNQIPHVSIAQLRRDPSLARIFSGKAVFVGYTAQTAVRDHLTSPLGLTTGVDIHAEAFETIAHRQFWRTIPDDLVLLGCLLAAAGIGVLFWFWPGWRAYTIAGVWLLSLPLLPAWTYRHAVLLPIASLLFTSWMTAIFAAASQYFTTRRRLIDAETQRVRYQEAIHFVTHEMRSPLTAIQGSSELMGRYNLSDDKRKQMAQMINTESKRLARMIQTFLDIERISGGQVELKREPFAVGALVEACVERVRALAERKQMQLVVMPLPNRTLTGDRELMEYAVYNLLTNAIKYSPAETVVKIWSEEKGSHLRLSVQDQGMGMDEKELRNIFRKFYRTRKAEASGESGTGIGLSIVEQIITHHGGTIEVSSIPGKGSCFTLVLPVTVGQLSIEPQPAHH